MYFLRSGVHGSDRDYTKQVGGFHLFTGVTYPTYFYRGEIIHLPIPAGHPSRLNC